MASPSLPMVALLAESPDAQPFLQHACDTLNDFGVPFIERVLESRAALRETVASFDAAGAGVFIVAGTSADPLPTAVAALAQKPVLAIPLEAPGLTPLDALRAATRGGPALATLAIGKAGAINAALLAVAIFANADPALRRKLDAFRADQTERVLADTLE